MLTWIHAQHDVNAKLALRAERASTASQEAADSLCKEVLSKEKGKEGRGAVREGGRGGHQDFVCLRRWKHGSAQTSAAAAWSEQSEWRLEKFTIPILQTTIREHMWVGFDRTGLDSCMRPRMEWTSGRSEQ